MKKKKQTGGISSFLGSNSNIEGIVDFKDTIRLDGKVKGKILGNKGTLIVGKDAEIQAEIDVGTAIIMGNVKGKILASDRVEAYFPAQITGDISAPEVSLEKGVQLNGNCDIKPMKIDKTDGEKNLKNL